MQDWHPAVEAHRSILEQARQPWAQDGRGAWTQSRMMDYGMEAAIPSAIAFQHEIEDLLASDTFMVSPEMMELTYHAFAGFDRTEPAHPEEFFVDAGFIYLAEPFVSLDIHGKRTAWRAMNYRLVPDVPIERDGETVYEWGLRIIMYLGMEERDADDYPIPIELVEHAKQRGMHWGYTHATTLPLALVHDTKGVSGEGDPEANWLTFFRVLHRLMAERIVIRTAAHVPRPQRRDYRRTMGREAPICTVIELRRPSPRATDSERESSRNYTHRWIVRGHWRNQWYPSMKQHKQKWIAAYEKGPDDGDLIIKERVWVWDR